MSLSQIFRRVLIPCAAGVSSLEGHTFGPNCVKKVEEGTRPSDLPIYSKQCSICGEENANPPPPSSMEETVGNIRRELWVWQDSLRGYRQKVVDVYRNGFSKADCPDANETNARNHLDRSFDEKSYQPSPCHDGKKPITDFRGFRSAWSKQPQFDRPCLDRCGKPWVDPNQNKQPEKAPCKEAKPPPCPPPEPKPKAQPPCEGGQAPPKAPCQHLPGKKPHLCEHKQPKPPCEGSKTTNKNYCSCCPSSECSGQT